MILDLPPGPVGYLFKIYINIIIVQKINNLLLEAISYYHHIAIPRLNFDQKSHNNAISRSDLIAVPNLNKIVDVSLIMTRDQYNAISRRGINHRPILMSIKPKH